MIHSRRRLGQIDHLRRSEAMPLGIGEDLDLGPEGVVAVDRDDPPDFLGVQPHDGARRKDGDLRQQHLDEGRRELIVARLDDVADGLVRPQPRAR